jgi:hypothetical protein
MLTEVKEENKAKYEFTYRVQDNDFHPTEVGRSEQENIPSDADTQRQEMVRKLGDVIS